MMEKLFVGEKWEEWLESFKQIAHAFLLDLSCWCRIWSVSHHIFIEHLLQGYTRQKHPRSGGNKINMQTINWNNFRWWKALQRIIKETGSGSRCFNLYHFSFFLPFFPLFLFPPPLYLSFPWILTSIRWPTGLTKIGLKRPVSTVTKIALHR